MKANFTTFFLSLYNANYGRDYKKPFTIVCGAFTNPRSLMMVSDPFIIAISNGSNAMQYSTGLTIKMTSIPSFSELTVATSNPVAGGLTSLLFTFTPTIEMLQGD